MLKQLDTATVKIYRGKPENQQMGQYFKLFCQWLDLKTGLVSIIYDCRITCQDGGNFW